MEIQTELQIQVSTICECSCLLIQDNAKSEYIHHWRAEISMCSYNRITLTSPFGERSSTAKNGSIGVMQYYLKYHRIAAVNK